MPGPTGTGWVAAAVRLARRRSPRCYSAGVVRLLLRAVVFLASAAVGLFVTSLLVDGFRLTGNGFLLTLIVFAALQSVLAPLIGGLVKRHARAFVSGVGLLSTFVSLVVATHFTDGLQIRGFTAWVAATLLVWAITAAATLVIPWLMPSSRPGAKGKKTARA